MTNRIYLIGSEKGGVGKTSIAFNLAILRATAGYPTLLVDADKQTSSAIWASVRADNGYKPFFICVQKLGKIGNDLLELKRNYEVIVDAGGTDSQELRQGIAVADRWIIPVRPSQLDLFSMSKMYRLMDEVKERVGRGPDTSIVLNAVAPSTTEGEECRALLEEDPKVPVMQTKLIDLVAMRRAVMAGCGVTELTGKKRSDSANQQMIAFYEEVFGEPFVAVEPSQENEDDAS
jgi:chromosome partitioning protein